MAQVAVATYVPGLSLVVETLQVADERATGQVTENSYFWAASSVTVFGGTHVLQSAVVQIGSVPEATANLKDDGATTSSHGVELVFVNDSAKVCLPVTLTFRGAATAMLIDADKHRGNCAVGVAGSSALVDGESAPVDGETAGEGSNVSAEGSVTAGPAGPAGSPSCVIPVAPLRVRDEPRTAQVTVPTIARNRTSTTIRRVQ